MFNGNFSSFASIPVMYHYKTALRYCRYKQT
nr:MAG TPA: hypothetical protein [Caudoviricetes sp.]